MKLRLNWIDVRHYPTSGIIEVESREELEKMLEEKSVDELDFEDIEIGDFWSDDIQDLEINDY